MMKNKHPPTAAMSLYLLTVSLRKQGRKVQPSGDAEGAGKRESAIGNRQNPHDLLDLRFPISDYRLGQAFNPCRSSRARISPALRVPPVSFSFHIASVSKRLSPIASPHGSSAASSSPADQTSPPRLRIIAMT